MANKNMNEAEKAAAKKAALDEKIEQAQESLTAVQSEGDAEKGVTVNDEPLDLDTADDSDNSGDVIPAPEHEPDGAAVGTGLVELVLRNKTGNKTYYRCGVCIGNEFTPVKISAEDVIRLRSDPWVEEKK